MATEAWTYPLDWRTDADARDAVADLHTHLQAAGLVHVPQTGDFDFSTASPRTEAGDGHLVYRFDDGQQANAPIFIRIVPTSFGASGPDRARLIMTVGDATDGAGGVTFDGAAARVYTLQFSTTGLGNNWLTDGTVRQSFVCVTDGFFGLVWGVVALNHAAVSAAMVQRTVDVDGVPDDIGVQFIGQGANTLSNNTIATPQTSMRYNPTRRLFASVNSAFYRPSNENNSLVDGDAQIFATWAWLPKVQPMVGVVGCLQGELSSYMTFDATVVGTTPRTYLAIGRTNGCLGIGGTAAHLAQAMLWE